MKEWEELKEFFLEEHHKTELEKMGNFKRWAYMTSWLLKGLFHRLAPLNRILLIFALFFLVADVTYTDDDGNSSSRGLDFLAGIIFLFIIMLELKDKLLAKTELRVGRFVQKALIPEGDPNIPGWSAWLFTRPANDVGGDLVDYLQLDTTRYGIVLADVVGKGLGAALLMAKLQATLRAVAPDFKNLANLGTKINQIFYRDTMPKSFASMVYLELNTESKTLKVLNAGHLPPLIVRDNQITELPKGGPGIGLSPKSKYEEVEIDIDVGNMVIVFSDGVPKLAMKMDYFMVKKNYYGKLIN